MSIDPASICASGSRSLQLLCTHAAITQLTIMTTISVVALRLEAADGGGRNMEEVDAPE